MFGVPRWISLTCVLSVAFPIAGIAPIRAEEKPKQINLLFLGDRGHHRPYERYEQLAPVMRHRGIDLVYTEDVAELNAETLGQYDGLVIYANITEISSEQEKALLDFVAGGKGFIPLHCASYCFLNSEMYVELVGAQFQRHETGIFRVKNVAPDHPIMKGYKGFRSWDETYSHTKHNATGRTVLEVREQDGQEEPWTWVRTQGKGRVFYTAWGHDQRTWSNPGFQNLVERGIRWAVGGNPSAAGAFADRLPMTAPRTDVKAFEYVDVGPKIPNYTPSRQWGTQGKAFTKMQKPLPPEESVKHYVTPVGFEMKLFVSEPDLQGKPIAMTWDERGRLWVCETYDYPNQLQAPGEGRDRIRICEDTDGDGRADKFTVFAEKLSIPTSIAFHKGGAIVQNATQTLYLKDTDGDDVADERTVMFTGWALNDTHGGVSNFQYGFDNWIYAMQGYNNSTPTIDGVPQQNFRMGFFRFRPDGSAIEFLRSTNNNTWGLGITEEGLVFGSTANRNPSDFMAIPNRYYERVKGWGPQQLEGIADTYKFAPITDKVRQVDQHGGYTAGAGHAVYTARTYPEFFWNRTAFVCGPTGHLVGTFRLNADGAGFLSTSPMNLVASDDEWSAPIMAEVGPDGNVWIIDWYNYIVQHNPTPQGFTTGRGNAYESDLRDKRHGRIYRLVYKDAEEYVPVNLANASPKKLVETLRHPTLLWRKHAQRLLVERVEADRGPFSKVHIGNVDRRDPRAREIVEANANDVVPALVELASDQSVDEIGLNVGAIHALWTLHGLGRITPEYSEPYQATLAALKHPSAGVRRNALQVLPGDAATIDKIVVSGVLADDDAQVRLAALLALADGEANDSAGAAAATIAAMPETSLDRWMRDAVTSAGATHAYSFLKTLAREGGAEPALPVVAIVAEHVARSKPSAAELNGLLIGLKDGETPLVETVVAGLAAGWDREHRVKLSPEAEDVLVGWVTPLSPGGKGQLVGLATAWGSTKLEAYSAEIAADLMKLLKDGDRSEADRIAAARQLIGFRPDDGDAVEGVLELVTPQASTSFAAGLLEAVAASRAENAAETILEKTTSMTPLARQAAMGVLLARPETTRAFLDAVADGKATLSELSLDQKQALAAHPQRDIRRRARRLLEQKGGLPNPDRQKVLAELMPLTEKTGDPAAGKELFKKHCIKCHTHSGEGAKIGPDLTGMAVHPKAELLGHIIDPSKDVEGNFRIYTVVTTEGKIVSGLLAGESKTTLELFDAEGKKQTLLREDVEELLASRKSLMPEGFEKQVTPDGLVDLLEFLTQKGKYVPIPLQEAATIVTTQGMFFEKSGQAERMIFSDWSPKTFDGVPFQLVDPQGTRVPNAILLYSPNGKTASTMPRRVEFDCNTPAKAIHFLSGVAGWGFPYSREKSVSMIVRLRYADGQSEEHELKNGVEFADYIRRIDVPGSKFAFNLRGRQLRYFSVEPKRQEAISKVELVKGEDRTAPIVMAVTVETR